MHEVKLPQMGQSVEEASIVRWLKSEGDAVKQGEPLFAIQTDKAEIECESPASGVLRKILLETDITVPVMTVVALIGGANEPLPVARAQPAPAPKPADAASSQPAARDRLRVGRDAVSAPGFTAEAKVSPRARKQAGRLRLDPALVSGTGAQGRVTEADVIAYAQARKDVAATPTARRLAEAKTVDLSCVQGSGQRGRIMRADVERTASTRAVAPVTASGPSKRVPLTPMRRIIAQRMSDSFYTAPHYYVTVEVDMSAAVRFRNSQSEKPSYNDLILYATAQALEEYPTVNARWTDDSVEEVADINLGFAVALPAGLMVPVVRKVQTKTLAELSRACRELTEKTRNGKLTPDDYSGNTFTISNLGVYGIDDFTAIINQPDSAILAVGQIKDRPVAVNGGVQVRPIMKMTLSSDHRVIDGALAAQFMGKLKDILEQAAFDS